MNNLHFEEYLDIEYHLPKVLYSIVYLHYISYESNNIRNCLLKVKKRIRFENTPRRIPTSHIPQFSDGEIYSGAELTS